MAAGERANFDPDYLQVYPLGHATGLSPTRSHFSSDSELELDEEADASESSEEESKYRKPIPSGHSFAFNARTDEDATLSEGTSEMSSHNHFHDDNPSHHPSHSAEHTRVPSPQGKGTRSGVRSDEAAEGEERHLRWGYRFPSYRPIPVASTSSATLATLPSDVNHPLAPPGLESRDDLDEDIDMTPNTPDERRRRIGDLNISIEDTKKPERREGRCDGAEKRGGLAPEHRKEGLSKMTVTMKSPTANDFREVTPIPFQYPPQHTRDDSEPGSAFLSGLSTPGGSDGIPSDDDYDWSGEEDLADQQAKFGEQMGQKTKREGWGVKRILSLLFSTLIGSTFLSGLLITPPLIVHFYWYKPNPTPERRYIDDNIQAWLFWVAANVTISWFLALMIDIIPFLVRYLLLATWGHVSEAFKSRLETYASVKDTAKPAFYAASALASWVIIFAHIYGLYSLDPEVDSTAPYADRVYQVILFFFFLVLMVCVQQMLSHYIAYNFHQTAYKERIEAVQKALSVIEVLQNYHPKTHKRTGTQTPGGTFLFESGRMSEKEHYRKLNSALKSVQSEHRRETSRLSASNIPTPDPGREADMEDADRTLVDPAKKTKRRSGLWLTTPADEIKDPFANPRNSKTEEEMIDIPLQPIERPLRPPLSTADSGTQLEASTSHRPMPSGVSFTDTARGSPERGERYPPRPAHHRTNTGYSDVDVKVVHAAKVIGKAILHDARNIQGNQEDLLSWNVTSTTEAKRLARSIFRRLKDRHRKYLIASDFYPAFPTHEAAEEAFEVFDKDGNGDLSRAEIKSKLVKTYRERRFLSRSLKDVGEALQTLDRILLVFALIILGFIALSVFGVEVGDSLTSMYSIAIAASFIFKSSASRAFDAIMFLFATHPYDTGDRCFIDAENLVVKKVGLFATVFSRSDGTETYYFNSQLFNKFITNARRSDKTTEMLNLQVGWKTPLTKLDALEKYLNEWLSTEENRWYQPNTGVTLQHIQYQRYLTLTIGIPHNGNWQDWGLRNARRTAFHAAVQYYCRQLGISGYEAPIPIVFSDQEASWTSRSDTLAKDGETNLEVPSAPIDETSPGDGTRMSEQRLSGDQEDFAMRPTSLATEPAKPSLGFLPPPEFRANSAQRARKSHRSRKDKLSAMHAEG